MRSGSDEDEKGISFRQLVVAFLAVVALCAVFFSLGFFLGYKERTSAAPVTENVSPPADVPPVVNPSAGSTEAGTAGTPASSASGSPAIPAERTPGSVVEESNLPNSAASQAPVPPVSENVERPAAVSPVRSALIGGTTVQVAALSNLEDAESLIKVLKARGYAPFMMSPEQAHANDSFFRVVVGPFGSAAEAGRVREKLARDGFKPFIRK